MNYGFEYKGIDRYKEKREINITNILLIIFILFFSIGIYIGVKISYSKIKQNNNQVSKKINTHKEVNLQLDYTGKVNSSLKSIDYNYLYNKVIVEPDKISFVDSIKESAVQGYFQDGIYPSITIAQAILESAWGTSQLAVESNNLFGIKADNRWNGATTTVITKENYDDVIEANFRKYDSIISSIQDHGEFLLNGKRYTDSGVFKAKNYKEQAQALEDAGYSTSKNENGEKIYADKLINIIEKYNLIVFDNAVEKK